MRLIRSAVLLAAVALPLAPVAAHADASGHHDAVRDVRSVAYDPATKKVTETPSTAEPAVTRGDIARVRVAHTARVLKVTLRFVDLAPAGTQQIHEVAIASPKGNRIVFLAAGPGNWAGKAILRKPSGRKVACSVHRRIDYARNTVVVKVPRTCLHRPNVVKVGAASLVVDGSKVYYDDAYAAGGEFTDPFTLSRRIHR